MSSLQSINGFNLDSDLVQKFLKDYTVLAKNLLVALTCGCLILFKTMLFICASVLTELLPHPIYMWKQMSPLSILGGKKLQYCLKLSCKYSNPAYATVFNSKFYSVFERKPTQLPPLAIRVSGDLV